MNPNRTELESLTMIRSAFAAYRLQMSGHCKYVDEYNKPCAIGFLLTPEQIERLKSGNCNGKPIGNSEVADLIGDDELLATTGMTRFRCSEVQSQFDMYGASFGHYLAREIAHLTATSAK